ncbi:hypothetical protein Vretimale_13167 [Volvox reticuliferus]|uniref:Phosphoinositide phospholipase C n=1 Tax=Volvox reticuliferus TaxID=1737510 RepID=A0A8J4GJT5_9CHLO|nr:hypothetical protein Vretifemale_14125 [Volvox reticuliferus]GIM09335.1 hypothetical protein Vretimale_13167 [Volvox reticuliferus]
MGNSCTCFEKDIWDGHPGVTASYPEDSEVYQDMTLPLPHYFISSGHNSYLTGDQLFARAGTATILKSLRAGCRIIELDVYNGPICKHGGTFTSPVSFQACIEAINHAAFTTSNYPVIITMENHADVANQGKMAEILRKVLGERLFVPDPNDSKREFLSPAELSGKMVCRTTIKDSGTYHPEFRKLIYIRITKCSSLKDMITREEVVSSSFEESAMPQSDELGPDNSEAKAERQKEKLLKKRGKLKGQLVKSPEDFGDETEDAMPPGEGRMVAGSLQELYTYASRHLVRVYPALWRVTSGNYNPMRAWVRGTSVAALNWQVWDKALWCNEAKFQDNGRCGYVLKPQWMRSPEAKLPQGNPRKLVVRVHSAHKHQGGNCFVFKDDLFVKINIWGMPCDCSSRKTHTANDTGRLVVDEEFEFTLRFPEMAVLCLVLKDDDAGGIGGAVRTAVADSLGYFALPLSTLKEGDYKLALKDPSTGRPLDAQRNWIKVGLYWEDGAKGEDTDRRQDKEPAAGEATNPTYTGRSP